MSQDIHFVESSSRPMSVIRIPDAPLALIDPNDVILRVCRRLARDIPKKVRMSTFLSRSVGPRKMDPMKFEHIVINAILASPVMTSQRGKLRISTLCTAGEMPPDDRWFEIVQKVDGLKNTCSIEIRIRPAHST
jgi:hypothetical protein